MPSKKGTEQAILWLRSKAAEGMTLDAINADLCLNVIRDLQAQLSRKGAIIHSLKMKEDVSEYEPYAGMKIYDDGFTDP